MFLFEKNHHEGTPELFCSSDEASLDLGNHLKSRRKPHPVSSGTSPSVLDGEGGCILSSGRCSNVVVGHNSVRTPQQPLNFENLKNDVDSPEALFSDEHHAHLVPPQSDSHFFANPTPFLSPSFVCSDSEKAEALMAKNEFEKPGSLAQVTTRNAGADRIGEKADTENHVTAPRQLGVIEIDCFNKSQLKSVYENKYFISIISDRRSNVEDKLKLLEQAIQQKKIGKKFLATWNKKNVTFCLGGVSLNDFFQHHFQKST